MPYQLPLWTPHINPYQPPSTPINPYQLPISTTPMNYPYQLLILTPPINAYQPLSTLINYPSNHINPDQLLSTHINTYQPLSTTPINPYQPLSAGQQRASRDRERRRLQGHPGRHHDRRPSGGNKSGQGACAAAARNVPPFARSGSWPPPGRYELARRGVHALARDPYGRAQGAGDEERDGVGKPRAKRRCF